MHLLRAWWTQILRGAALAVTVPAAILVAALTVGAAGGGLRELGSLTQALTGPQVPAVEPAGTRADRDPRRLLDRSMRRPRARAAARRAAGSGRAPSGLRADGNRRSGGDGRDRAPASDPPAGRPGGRPPAPTPPAEPEPGPIRRVGDRVKDVARGVPVAGEPASDVVEAIVDTVESLPPTDAPLPASDAPLLP